jgi:protein phosphatase
VLIDVTAHRIADGDAILLCSDGLTDCVGDEEIKDIVLSLSPANAARTLVDKAKELGGEDNISIVIARVDDIPAIACTEDALGVEKYLVP